eukprot:Skav235167  [mRNA]  locus=scaffold721:134150:145585:- [translate_table: standard]
MGAPKGKGGKGKGGKDAKAAGKGKAQGKAQGKGGKATSTATKGGKGGKAAATGKGAAEKWVQVKPTVLVTGCAGYVATLDAKDVQKELIEPAVLEDDDWNDDAPDTPMKGSKRRAQRLSKAGHVPSSLVHLRSLDKVKAMEKEGAVGKRFLIASEAVYSNVMVQMAEMIADRPDSRSVYLLVSVVSIGTPEEGAEKSSMMSVIEVKAAQVTHPTGDPKFAVMQPFPAAISEREADPFLM